MARIERVELRLVDIPPKVKRTDAIQSFVSQETPIVAITDSDGAIGTGYSYTIGTGGSSVMRLLADHLAPRLIGKDAERIEAIWRELEFATHATTIGAISALALAAIDTALWDLRCRRRELPSGSSRAAPRTAGPFIRPKEDGFISTSRRWSTTRSPHGSEDSQVRRSRSVGRARQRTIVVSLRCARRSVPTTRS
jgi:Mandelate racemase / muconate lactonizing enzyme, N-terminal domain